MDYKTIMAEFEERFNNKEDVKNVKTETYDGVLAKRKQFTGVSKMRNKWRARIQHPKLKLQVHLGCYRTPEEAALVVKNKKAEFEDTLKAENGLSVRSRKDKSDGRKLPRGVSKRKSGKFRVKIWHPELKRCVSFGCYSTVEEAAVVADRKRTELRELYGGKPIGRVDNDEILQDCKSEAPDKFECLNEQTTCSLEFDEAVSAGFINEYGQLMGKYRELDEQLWLGLPDEKFAASG